MLLRRNICQLSIVETWARVLRRGDWASVNWLVCCFMELELALVVAQAAHVTEWCYFETSSKHLGPGGQWATRNTRKRCIIALSFLVVYLQFWIDQVNLFSIALFPCCIGGIGIIYGSEVPPLYMLILVWVCVCVSGHDTLIHSNIVEFAITVYKDSYVWYSTEINTWSPAFPDLY